MKIIEIIEEDYQNFPCQQTYSIYTENVYFEDPLNKFTGLKRYQKMIKFIETLFQNIQLELHSIEQKEQTIITEWTLNMTSPLPWKPRLSIPGWSELKLNEQELIVVHCDRWRITPWQLLLQNFSSDRVRSK